MTDPRVATDHLTLAMPPKPAPKISLATILFILAGKVAGDCRPAMQRTPPTALTPIARIPLLLAAVASSVPRFTFWITGGGARVLARGDGREGAMGRMREENAISLMYLLHRGLLRELK